MTIRGRLVSLMLVDETLTFDEYWEDSRFRNKCPVFNKSIYFGENVISIPTEFDILIRRNIGYKICKDEMLIGNFIEYIRSILRLEYMVSLIAEEKVHLSIMEEIDEDNFL